MELISVDYDDNKFVDCAISAGAKCIVSNDKHFKILKEIDFPKLEVITDDEFLSLIDF
jgi:predicted nucleic acid-binding protein